MSELTLRVMVNKAKDEVRSTQAFNRVIDKFVKENFTVEGAKEVYRSLYTDRHNAKMKVQAIQSLYTEVKDMSMVQLRDYNTKDNVPDGEIRGMLWKLYHNAVRYEALDVILNDSMYAKKMMKFSNRFTKLIKILLLAQMESKDGTVLAQVVTNRLKSVLPEMPDDGSGIAETIIMILLYALGDTPLVDVSMVENSETKAKTHRLHFNMIVPTELLDALSKVRKRGINLEPAKEYEEGEVYNTTSKRSWKGYRDIPKSKEMAKLFNIRNGCKLSFNLADFSNKLYAGLTAKFGVDPAVTKGNKQLEWTIRASKEAMAEAQEIIDRGNEFYIEHFGDRVQRNYEKSEYFGMGQCKELRHLIELGDKKPLDAVGKQAIKLDIAAKNGYDKVEEQEAMDAYAKHSKEWRDNGKTDYEFSLLRSKKDVGFLIEQDATNSGTQMYALGTGSLSLAAICGLDNSAGRLDAYQLLVDLLNEKLGTDKFNRSNTKSLFMTKLYNAGKQLLLWGGDVSKDADGYEVAEWVARENGKMIPLMLTVPDMDPEVVWAAFDSAMWYLAPDALRAMKKISTLIDDRLIYEWAMPDGALCQTAMTQVQEKRIEWYDANDKRHTMTYHEKVLVAEAKAAALAPAIVQGMDAYVLRVVTRKAKAEGFDVVTLHDAFFSHPNDTVRVRELYRETLAEVHKMDLMTEIYNQLTTGTKLKTLQVGDLSEQTVLDSEYSLWA